MENREKSMEAENRPLLDNNSGKLTLSKEKKNSGKLTFVVVFSTFTAAGSFICGNAMKYSSRAKVDIVNDLGLTFAEFSAFGLIQSIGAILGALASGKLADVIGRRGAMGFSDLICIMGWLAIAFAEVSWWVDVGEFLVGCGIGLISNYALFISIAEITPNNDRGSWFMSTKHLMIRFGKAFISLIGSVVSRRTLALIGLVPCLLQLVGLLGLFFIDDSPRWLMKTKQVEKFETAHYLRGDHADISHEKNDQIKHYAENCKTVQGEGILSLFQWKYARPLTIGLRLLLFHQLVGFGGIVFYTSTILQSGFPSYFGMVVGIAQTIFSMLGVCSKEKFGRQPLLLISAAGICLGCFFLGVSFFLKFGEKPDTCLALLGVSVYSAFFGLGMEGMPWIVALELVPVNIKGSAGSVLNALYWFSSWLIFYCFNFIFKWCSAGTFFIFAAVCGANVLFIWKLKTPEKSHEEEESTDDDQSTTNINEFGTTDVL